MRKAMAALMLGTFVLGQSVVASAAAANPKAPVSAVAGRINNRAVLGVAAAQGASDVCVPADANDRHCDVDPNNRTTPSGNVLPIVAVGIGVAVAVGVAAGGNGKGGVSP